MFKRVEFLLLGQRLSLALAVAQGSAVVLEGFITL